MSQKNPQNQDNGSNGTFGNSTSFERSKYRQTMPSNSRFNPLTPPEKNHLSRFNSNNKSGSPTQSYVSTATTYEVPWKSQNFADSPNGKEEARFRRTLSVAVRKPEENGGNDQKKSDRPKINFKEFSKFGKKITNKFKKNESKKGQGSSRMSAPVIKLKDSAATSQSSLPTPPPPAKPSPVKKMKAVASTTNMKLQQEDLKKKYQKMYREQSMKESNLQRMQRERQRDFSVVLGPGRACLAANAAPSTTTGSVQSIDSMVVFNTTPSRRSVSMSMNDDDTEPFFKNSQTQKHVTSAQVSTMKTTNSRLSNGPSFTSTPRLAGTKTASPTISNVRPTSESSLCFIPLENGSVQNKTNNSTMYFSTDGLSSAGRDTPASIASSVKPLGDLTMGSTSSTPVNRVAIKPVKQEVYDSGARSSSNCPSISSTPPTTEPDNQHQNGSAQPAQLNDLWLVSQEIRDKQLFLGRYLPLFEGMKARNSDIEQEKMVLIDNRGDNPSHDDMCRMWNLHREQHQLNYNIMNTARDIQNANTELSFLESRRNQLLSTAEQPAVFGGSLV